MQKLFYILFILQTLVSADKFTNYTSSSFIKEPHTFYAYASINTTSKNYKNEIRAILYKDIASQIYSLVDSETTLKYKGSNDELSKSFNQNTVISSKNIPLYNLVYIKEKSKNGIYSAVLSFNYKKAFPHYLSKNKILVAKINQLYTAYKNTRLLSIKEATLSKILSTYKEQERHSFIIHFIEPKHKLLKPNVTSVHVQNTLDSLYDANANNIRDLAKILVKRLNINLSKSIKVEPITLKDGHLYSNFSYEFKSYLTDSLNNITKVSQNNNSHYVAKGFYHLDANHVVVNITIINRNKEIIASAIAKMYLKDSDILLQKYKPLYVQGEYTEILDEYMKGW